MVSTTITFRKGDVQPPVFVAGSFTKWTTLEMDLRRSNATGDDENEFFYETDLQPGEYQYKFRLGPGDWWVVDESSPSANDGSGNINNVLTVTPEEPKSSQSQTEKSSSTIPVDVESEPASTPLSEKESPQTGPLLSEPKPSTAVTANIGQKLVKEQGTKDVPEEKSEKVNSHFDGHKEDSLPDIAPPPYSAATETGAGLTHSSLKSESTTLEGANDRNNSRSGDIKGSAESKQSNKSWTSGLCSGNVALVLAVLVVPVAVSFLWYR